MKKFSYGKRSFKSKRRLYRRPTAKLNTSPRVTKSFNVKAKKNGEFTQRLGSLKTIGTFINGAAPFPEIAYTTHRYCETFSLYADNVTGLVGSTQTMRLNNMYDPNSTGVGHQVSGFDQLTYIYGRWTVYAVNINIRVHAADGQTGFLALAIKPPVASGSAWLMAGRKGENLIETQNCFVLDCPATNAVQHWSSGWMNIGTLAGIDQSQVFNDVSYMGYVGGGPAALIDLVLGVGTYNLEAGKYVRFTLSIDYKAKWTQRNAIEQS